MITAEEQMGRAIQVSFGSDQQLYTGIRWWTLIPSGAGLAVVLPAGNAKNMRLGGIHFYLFNNSAHSLDLKNQGGTVIRTIAAGKVVEVGCTRVTTTNGSWWHSEHTRLT